ncbi:MAG: hypothetical protein ACM4AI_12675, partial [Acidobacteriota bacterium]
MSTRTASTGQARVDRQTSEQGRDRASAFVTRRPNIFGVPGLELILPSGARVIRGGPPTASIRLNTKRAVRALLVRDQMRMFEAFMDQEIDIEPLAGQDAAAAFLAVARALDEHWTDFRWLSSAIYSSRYFWQQRTAARRAKLAVHYSVPKEFWLSFMTNDYPIYSHYL